MLRRGGKRIRMDDPPEDYETPFTPYSVQPQTPMDVQGYKLLYILNENMMNPVVFIFFFFNYVCIGICMEVDTMDNSMNLSTQTLGRAPLPHQELIMIKLLAKISTISMCSIQT